MPGLSNWREEFNLSEVVTGKMTDTKALQKVSEKSNINNKVTINPKLDEAVKEIGGEVVGMVEADTTAQKQRIDMKQMILDRQKLKIRRKDLSAAKKEQQNDVEGDSTNASKQSNVIAQEAVQGQDTATRKAMAGERKAGDKRVAPGKAKQNAERVMQSVRFYDKITKGKHIAGVAEETEVKEGVMKFVKGIGKKKKVEKKPSMDTITTKVHKWRKDREKEERRKYVSDFDPIDEGTDKAFDFVKNKLKAKYGDGVLTTGEKMKPPTAAQKKAAAAHQAKVDAENAAARAKDPSQGRYPKG